MIFVDANVFMYAVGRAHSLRDDARRFFEDGRRDGAQLVTSAEVLQELLHAYVAVGRFETLDSALTLAESSVTHVWPVEQEDVRLARALLERHPRLGARDVLHLACCRRKAVQRVKTYDRALQNAFRAP